MITPAAVEYRDRTTGLLVFGVLEILLGALCFLMVALMLVGLLISDRYAGSPLTLRALVPGIGFYGALAVVFVWLGIGSIGARRWARALWLCLSVIGLCMGLAALPFMLSMSSHFGEAAAQSGGPPLPPTARVIGEVFMVGSMLLAYVVIPGALFLFYRSPHVRHTCEVRDPVERWTDRCPMPVLGLSVFMAFGALGFLFLLGFGGVFPVFGRFLFGLAGRLLTLLAAGLWLYLAWGLYKLRKGIWWLALAAVLIVGISSTMTLWASDLGAVYLKMGFDSRLAASAAEMGKLIFAKWYGSVWLLPWLAWLFYVRRYFPKAPAVGPTVGS